MPIASKVMLGIDMVDESTGVGLPPKAPLVRDFVIRAVKVDAQAASDMFHTSSSYFDDRTEYPPTRLPYPALWIEWAVFKLGIPSHHFAVIEAWQPEYWRGRVGPGPFDRDDAHEVISVTGGGIMRDGKIYVAACTGVAVTNRNGDIIPNDKGTPLQVVAPSEHAEHFNEIGAALTKPALLALGLMNTKNIDLVPNTTSSISRKQQRRQRIPRFDYHVITLPGSRSSSGSREWTTSVRGATAQHLVRGHFKTYTSGAPLMGKHTGTYWWSHSVRGNPENGVVISDYQLKSPATGDQVETVTKLRK